MNLLERLMGRQPDSSSAVAKQRLKIVLEYDRVDLSPAIIEIIRQDIIEAISNHVSIEPDDVAVTLEEGAALVAHIPLPAAGSRQSAMTAESKP